MYDDIRTINIRYRILEELSDRRLSALDTCTGKKVILTRFSSTNQFGPAELRTLIKDSNRASSGAILTPISAQRVRSINGARTRGRGYLLVDSLLQLPVLSEVDVSRSKMVKIIDSLIFELTHLGRQGISHGNLSASSILVEKNHVLLRDLRPQFFRKGKPDPKTELEKLKESLIAENRNDISDLIDERMPDEFQLRELTEPSDLNRGVRRSTWLAGIENTPEDLSLMIDNSRRTGFDNTQIIGFWECGLDMITSELITLRALSGSIVVELECNDQSDFSKLENIAVPMSPDVIEPMSSGWRQIELFVYLRMDDIDGSTIEKLHSISAGLNNNDGHLIVVTQHKLDALKNSYPAEVNNHVIDVSKQLGRASLTGYNSEYISSYDGISAAEVYDIVTGRSKRTQTANPLPNMMPGILLELAESVWNDCSEEDGDATFKVCITETGEVNRIWPIHYLRKPKADVEDQDLIRRTAETLIHRKCRRFIEALWLAIHFSRVSEDAKATFGKELLRFWLNNSSRLTSEQEILLLESSREAILGCWTDDSAFSFIKHILTVEPRRSRTISLACDTMEAFRKKNDCSDGTLMMLSILHAHDLHNRNELSESAKVCIDAIISPKTDRYGVLILGKLLTSKGMEDELSEERVLTVLEKAGKRFGNVSSSNLQPEITVLTAKAYLMRGKIEQASVLLSAIGSSAGEMDSSIRNIYHVSLSIVHQMDHEWNRAFKHLDLAHKFAVLSRNTGSRYTTLLNRSMVEIRAGVSSWSRASQLMERINDTFRERGAQQLITVTLFNLMAANMAMLNRNAAVGYMDKLLAKARYLWSSGTELYIRQFFFINLILGEPDKGLQAAKQFRENRTILEPTRTESTVLDALSSSRVHADNDIIHVLLNNLLYSRGEITAPNWLRSFASLSQKCTGEDILRRIRKSDLLSAYMFILSGIAREEIDKVFMAENRWLIRALDARYRRAGMVLMKSGNTPIEEALELRSIDLSALSSDEDVFYYGETVFGADEMCNVLARELLLDRVWVIRGDRSGYSVLSASNEVANRDLIPKWVRESLDWFNDSNEDHIDIRSVGLSRGKPNPGVAIIRVSQDELEREGITFYVVGDSLKPGLLLNKVLLSRLRFVAGLLCRTAYLEARLGQVGIDQNLLD
ncbi:MAG: hypothetical protein GF388_08910 [Candidatus Aegiribacteria sp.]|nr:hypothetical protein [Candidatus Aegiribacteria sp.]